MKCEWQPIVTAPKDGKEIILYGEAFRYNPRSSLGWKVVVCWYESGMWQTGFINMLMLKPTHWMSLPEPPTLAIL